MQKYHPKIRKLRGRPRVRPMTEELEREILASRDLAQKEKERAALFEKWAKRKEANPKPRRAYGYDFTDYPLVLRGTPSSRSAAKQVRDLRPLKRAK